MKTELTHSLTPLKATHSRPKMVSNLACARSSAPSGVHRVAQFHHRYQQSETACEVSNQPISDHVVDVNKMVDLGSGS